MAVPLMPVALLTQVSAGYLLHGGSSPKAVETGGEDPHFIFKIIKYFIVIKYFEFKCFWDLTCSYYASVSILGNDKKKNSEQNKLCILPYNMSKIITNNCKSKYELQLRTTIRKERY